MFPASAAVMAGLVPAIHVLLFVSRQERRGCPCRPRRIVRWKNSSPGCGQDRGRGTADAGGAKAVTAAVMAGQQARSAVFPSNVPPAGRSRLVHLSVGCALRRTKVRPATSLASRRPLLSSYVRAPQHERESAQHRTGCASPKALLSQSTIHLPASSRS